VLCLDRGECHRGRTPGHPEAESVESTTPQSRAALMLDACDAAQKVGNRSTVAGDGVGTASAARAAARPERLRAGESSP